MNKVFLLFVALSLHATAAAQQSSQRPMPADLSYSYAELRLIDVDVSGGDGFSIGGSYELDGPWIVIGSLTSLDFNNNVDSTLIEIGGGYVWDYSPSFDLVGTFSLVRNEFDTPIASSDDTGFALSGGARGYIANRVEIRGSVNHINLDNSDTFLRVAGDYHFTEQIAAGISLDLAGDTDSISLGARWLFN